MTEDTISTIRKALSFHPCAAHIPTLLISVLVNENDQEKGVRSPFGRMRRRNRQRPSSPEEASTNSTDSTTSTKDP